jgi:prevent-host-death family protein
MRRTIGIREFKNEATKIVRCVREEGTEYVITVNGQPAALLKPYELTQTENERRAAALSHVERLRELSARIAAARVSDLTAVELIREQRREL